MKLWKWFCSLGRNRINTGIPFLPQRRKVVAKPQQAPDLDGAEICTRLCGEGGGCRCGSTVRGMYCIWSYYRVPKESE